MINSYQLYESIAEQLLHPDFLNRVSLDKDFVLREIQHPHFMEKLTEMVNGNDFSSQTTYTLCKSSLDKLWGKQIPENPLFYIYQYTLSQSFPNSVEMKLIKEWERASLYYLHLLRVICQYEKRSSNNQMVSMYPLEFLSDEECNAYKVSKEYYQLKKAFSQEYIYEMMKLNQDVIGHNTLDHICGVHHLALFIGKQLYQGGLPLDLGRISGAAAGHDLGKFGCKSIEENRVAYLHYYYTDLWFKNHHITYIGNIALNHSVWDLELENLSLESLILIYCDFRVKNIPSPQGSLEMTYLSLKDSFQVILSKLDNLDHKKEKRYEKVYQKLKDFEDYMCHLGIVLDPNEIPSPPEKRKKKYYSLMKGEEITHHLKYLAIHHNIHLMYRLRDETSLNEMLEVIRCQEDPKNLREYLDVLQEYSTYLTQKQKIILLKFLYEKLIHPEEDIRRQCAELMGHLIALFDEDYRKEIPTGVHLLSEGKKAVHLLEEYLNLFINPDYKIIPLHRQWIGYTIKILITSVLKHCKSNEEYNFKKVILQYYTSQNNYEDYIVMSLLDVVGHIPLRGDKKGLEIVFTFVEKSYYPSTEALKIAALKAIYYLLPFIQQYEDFILPLNQLLLSKEEQGSLPAENYLKLKIIKALHWEPSLMEQYAKSYSLDLQDLSDLFLSNLKTATNWITKKVQIRMLLEHSLEGKNNNDLYTAMHFCNLLKVSPIESVRNSAGKALVSLMPRLPLEQRSDIVIELLGALELESYQFTKYIPNYLGAIVLYLQPFQLNQVIEDMAYKIKQSNHQIKSLLLKTTGIILINYPNYKALFVEDENIYLKRKQKLLGILLNGMAHDDFQVRQVAFSALGKEVFGSKVLSLEEKHHIFQYIGKKILTLLADIGENQLLFLTNSSGLNNIYRFIAEYTFKYGAIRVHVPQRLALFPGTFDPFTQGHKEICKAIEDKGFEVYLAVDEFSWSKRTQPHLIRKKIITMSIAEEMNIYLYPEDFPINIANPKDLKILKENLRSNNIFIVVGSDVILNASAYKLPPREYSIHQFSHIIFDRRNQGGDTQEFHLTEALKSIHGEVVQLNIPPQYEDISSTQIRNYIDNNMDISNLIDPLAQKYIYEKSLYRHEPQYKSVIQTLSVKVDIIEKRDKGLMENIIHSFHHGSREAYFHIENNLGKPEGRLILIRDAQNSNKLLAYGVIHWIPSDQIYQEWKNIYITSKIRENYKGRIISLDGFFINPAYTSKEMYQIILTETLTYCLKNDYGYAIFRNDITPDEDKNLINIIRLQGFVDIPYGGKKSVLAVDMSNPCTLSLDVENMMKEPFKSNKGVQKVVNKTRERLQKALTNLYPGNLVIGIHMGMINETLVRKICKENGVSPIPTKPRKLGPLMCVPFGNILNRAIVPNTITKSLHVERLFKPNMKGFNIGPYPYYLSLENQIKMISSFNKPVILVDDLLNKGYRIKGLDPILKKQGLDVHKIIVGILSGRGKELMDIQNRQVDCAYFIPKLRLWFNEDLLYPFIGGDTLWRGIDPEKNLISSINQILPYTSPHFIKGVTNQAIYELSEVALLNALDLLRVLEEEYQKIYERKLTLSLLGDVFIYPRYPDAGENIYYDLNMNPSSYLVNDLEVLKKLEYSIINRDERRQ